jgi:uncharacterized RDD family membrane protein YckC
VSVNGAADPTRAMQGKNAGFITRLTANVVDGLVLTVTWVGVLLFIGLVRFVAHPLRGFELPAPPTWVSGLTLCLLAILYFTVTWGGSGRSIGKRMAGVRLTADAGGPVRLGRSFFRAVLCVVFPIGFLWLLFSARNQSVYDIWLSTSVVYDWGLHPHVSEPGVRTTR